MAKVIKKEPKIKVLEKKKNTKKVDNNKVSIFPTLGIILALIIAALFYYNDTSRILINTLEDKEALNVTLEAIKIVSFNFVKFNVIALFLELVLYWKKKYKILYIVVGGIIIYNVLSIDLTSLLVSALPIVVGIYYIIKSLKKES
jgi:small-conductance mechanosensitive channel